MDTRLLTKSELKIFAAKCENHSPVIITLSKSQSITKLPVSAPYNHWISVHIQDASYELPAPIFRSTHIECRHGALRRMLIQKPHGDPSQCVNLVVPPANPAADAGLIIMGTMGYPDFSGSNAMCTMAAMFGTGRLSMGEGERRVVVEGWGEVSFSLVYGGVFYALITGVDIGLEAVNFTAL